MNLCDRPSYEGLMMNRLVNPKRLLTTNELTPLTQISNWRAALSVLQTWLVIALTLGVTLLFWSWPLVLVAIVIIGTQQHALFILSHEAVHFRMFGNRRVNDLVGGACAAAAGLSMCTYRVIHRLHHNHLYGAADPDMALHGGYPRGKWYLVRKLLKDLSGQTALKSYGYFFGRPVSAAETGELRPLADATRSLRTAARIDQRIVIGLQVTLPVVVFALGGAHALGLYLLLWVVPALTVLQVILRLRAICEHGAVDDTSSQLTATRTHRSGRSAGEFIARLALFPHHVNYHVEHHLYPAVPHYRLPQMHALLLRRGLLEPDRDKIGATLCKVFAERPATAS